MLLASFEFNSASVACCAQSITVADYSWQFFERVKQRKYGQTEEENSEVSGQNFYGKYRA